MPTDPDAMLVVATRNEKPAAFEELIGRYKRRIVRLAQNVTQNREDAEEVTQEAFFRTFAHLEGFKGDSRFSFSGLLNLTHRAQFSADGGVK